MAKCCQAIDIEIAVRMYYERISLSCTDRQKLFNIKSSATVAKYRREVIEYFADKDVSPLHRNNKLDTYRAYEAWGLDINDLEKRLQKLRKLNLQ